MSHHNANKLCRQASLLVDNNPRHAARLYERAAEHYTRVHMPVAASEARRTASELERMPATEQEA